MLFIPKLGFVYSYLSEYFLLKAGQVRECKLNFSQSQGIRVPLHTSVFTGDFRRAF